MRKLTVGFLLLMVLAFIAFEASSFSKTENKNVVIHKSSAEETLKMPSPELVKLQTKALLAKQFVKKKNFDACFCFLIDMSLPSNHKRFFIYDLKKDTILNSGLVTHGNCNQYWLTGRKYGNDVGCGCTSLGKYKIGNAYYGRFGLAFKLYGLEITNSNAFARAVVLHSHSCVPENEVDSDICQSNGCPTVSPDFLKKLEPMIKGSKKAVLLWIFE